MSSKFKYALWFVLGAMCICAVTYFIASRFIIKPEEAPVIKAEESDSQNNMERVMVSRVVDGDTLKVMINDTEETVRLIGINTPESVDPRTVVECFGKEASARMKELAEGQSVLLVEDPTQSVRDKYHRLLDYVYLSDGTLLNQKMIADGYAFEYTYDVPYEFQTEFKDAEKQAREKGLGLWDKSKCDYISNPKKSKQSN